MATIESIRLDLSPDVTAELANRAGDTARELVTFWQQVGIRLDPFEGETVVERGERTRRYAQHLRELLSDEDHQVIESSRLRSLR